MKISHSLTLVGTLAVFGWSATAHAYSSAEFLSNESYQYGRFEASIKFPSGSGVIGAFFLWKDGSEMEGTFWNELDFETLGFDCHLETNAYYGNPAQYHVERAPGDPVCDEYHTFAYEWTPDYVAWLVDGTEVRRETGDTAAAYRDNASDGMQFRFNVWPGDETFGGAFDPSLLPVYQYIDWIQYSSYDGSSFVLEWREDFDDPALPADWTLGTWDSPKGLSTHVIENAGVVDGALVLALTAYDAVGIPGVSPTTTTGGVGGSTSTSTSSATAGGGSDGSVSAGGASSTATGTLSGTATDTASASTTGAGGAGGVGATSTTAGSLSTASQSSATTTSTSSVVGSSTSGTTGSAAPDTTTALTATNGSGGGGAADDSGGCGCRTAGYGARPSSSGLAAMTLLALGAALRIRRRSTL